MSDEEEAPYVKKQKRVHYGSFEEQEASRLLQQQDVKQEDEKPDTGKPPGPNIPTTNSTPATATPVSQENIHTSNEYMELEEDMNRERAALLEEFERRKRARHINVSTDDEQVRKNLRQLGEPICLFGEGPADRRSRLRELLSKLGGDVIQKRQEEEDSRAMHDKDQETTWYHEGPASLRVARFWIAKYSLVRAKERLKNARLEAALPETTKTALKNEMHKKLQVLTIMASQVGDTRPVASCQFSPNSDYLATSSWSGLCKLWKVPSCELVRVFQGHEAQCSDVVFHPKATLSKEGLICELASCGTDGSVKLWAMDKEEPLADIEGHSPHRVSHLAFHPSGRFLATCVYDASWRLWDLEQCTEVLHQEGHSRAVHCVAFQNDGSIAATGGLDSFGRMWDLRTGRCVMFMEGHLSPIYSIDFSPNGFQVATGSGDHSCKIWDLRKRDCSYTIPSHMNLVSSVRFQKESSGHFLATASYDHTVKLWSHKTWQPLRTLPGHDNKVMCVDISPDSQYIATCSYDRTFKLWGPE